MKRMISALVALLFSVATVAAEGFAPSSVAVAPEGGTHVFKAGSIFERPRLTIGGLIPVQLPRYTFRSYRDATGALASCKATVASGEGLRVEATFAANNGTTTRSGYFLLNYEVQYPASGTSPAWTRIASDTIRFEQPCLLPPVPDPDDGFADDLSRTVRASGMDALVARSYTAPGSKPGASDGEYAATVSYFDALGFEVQRVEVGAACGGDRVTPRTYDFLWREDGRTYLPYASAAGGAYRPEALAQQAAYYRARYGDVPAYAAKEYECSVRRRILGSTAPGYTSLHGSTVAEDAPADFPRYVYRNGRPVADGSYARGEVVTVTEEDADGREVRITSDKFGRMLRRTVFGRREYRLGGVVMIEPLTAETWYVYDAGDRLRCIVPPEAAARIASLTDADLAAYCYRYEYDARDRIAARRLPGCSREEFAYDAADRIVCRRWDGKRTTHAFDALGRPLCDSLYASGVGRLTAEYAYDAYSDAAAALLDLASLAGADLRLRGMKTSERLAVLGEEGFLLRAFAYDYKGRTIRTAERYPDGTTLRTDVAYDFAGRPLSVEQTCERAAATDRFERSFVYDRWGRLLRETARLGGGDRALVAYEYDDLDRIAGKSYGAVAAESRAYDIRGCLTRSTTLQGADSLFALELHYDDPTLPRIRPSYTGNIAQWSWRHENGCRHAYGFDYDGLGRLCSTGHFVGDRSDDAFTERIAYDLNGNPLRLTRSDGAGADRPYVYTCSGNRPDTLAVGDAFYAFAYDASGNMVHDGLRGLNLSYNHLNLVENICRNDATLAEYRYLADGTKYSSLNGSREGLRYRGSLVYRVANGSERLESAGFGGGRLLVGATGRSEARYFVTDYLGSVRVVLDASGGVVERNDYYPFGLRWAVADQPVSDNRYRFHGKESQSFLNLPYHDYGARQYDPELALWRVVDPLLEADPSVSPYAFCGNNPVINVDPDGRIWDIVWDLLNLGYDVGAATYNEIKGDRKAAEVHWDDAKLDLIAALIPFVPAGASKGVRIANKALDAVRATDRTVDAARAVDHAADAAPVLKKAGKVPNPFGAKGKMDHQNLVEDLAEKAKLKLGPNERIMKEKKIQLEGSNRRPDVQIIDNEGFTRKIFEAERKPQSRRNILREEEYRRLGVEFETHPVE